MTIDLLAIDLPALGLLAFDLMTSNFLTFQLLALGPLSFQTNDLLAVEATKLGCQVGCQASEVMQP